MSMLLALLLAIPVPNISPTYLVEVTIYQGKPDGSKEKGEIQVLSKPRLITRNGDEAVVVIGQKIPVIVDIQEKNGVIQNTIEQETIGYTIKMTPRKQDDGSIFLASQVAIKEVVNDGASSILEQTVKTRRMYQLNHTQTVPLYNPNKYVQYVQKDKTGMAEKVTAPFSGKESWMDIKIVELPPIYAKRNSP